jgi:hypothetical protein
LHFDEETGETFPLAFLGERVDAVHLGPDGMLLGVSASNTTSFYELSTDTAPVGRRMVGALPSDTADVVWVADTSGIVTVYAAGAPRRVVAEASLDLPVIDAWMTADGPVIRSAGGLVWLGLSSGGRLGIERSELHGLSGGRELISRNYALEWNTDAWVLASLYRFAGAAPRGLGRWRARGRRGEVDRARAVWENAIVGRPRELQPFLGAHVLDAPGIRGDYYALGSVDYQRDRFVLYLNGMEGVLLVDGATGEPARVLDTVLPMYARHAIVATLVPATSWYVEMSTHDLSVWDLDNERLVAEERSDARYEDAHLNAADVVVTVVTADRLLRRLQLPDLSPLSDMHLPPWDSRIRIVSTGPAGLVAVEDAHHTLHIADTARATTFDPLGLDAAVAGCMFAPDGRSVLVVDDRGNVAGFELPLLVRA